MASVGHLSKKGLHSLKSVVDISIFTAVEHNEVYFILPNHSTKSVRNTTGKSETCKYL